ncbi:flap endonuclease 1 [Topomyia yanbarensis]|uniref:flap endonuclease 1 n=1 Tax=Topomyia yanbarensis TaxID=2498891 RepID=UPI00273C9AB0|nr:flap endonuclease 1 [Topomyia yanbarensis]XP_058830734.1 flap endonuclease 1 [Topomyia yanbarensis]
MGIKGLSQLIADVAPFAVKEGEIKNFFGRKVAIDASMCLYQFLIAVRAEGAQLTSVDGETTSHLMGTFYRTIRLLENGIKPVYVFDGKPPDLKSGELNKRAEKREEAQKALDKATEAGATEDIDKFNRRLVKVTKQHSNEAKELLKLMGVPYVDAPCEAEAQCAALVKGGKVYATATEDMDALTFGSSILLRHLTFSEARKMPVQEFNYEKLLSGFELNRDEFIDLCILLGCDYCDSIRGIGPKKAIELINKYRSIEKILENIDTTKYIVPENWNYQQARQLFKEPDVADPESLELKWVEPDEEGLVKYLCGDRQFNEDRIRAGAKKILKTKSTATQGRLDSFFKVLPSTPAQKRKPEDKKTPASKKAKTTAGKPGRKPK